MNGVEQVSFQIISAVGTAKSMYMQAIQLAKEKKFEEAYDKIENGDECFNQGHKAHMEMLSKQADGQTLDIDLLFMHAEDQMMSAETIKILSLEIIEIYKKCSSL